MADRTRTKLKRLLTTSGALALATCMLVAAAAAGPSRGDALWALATDARGAAPEEPPRCRGRVKTSTVRAEGTVEYREALCGSRVRDKFKTAGGGDGVWAYQGDDQIVSRDKKPDEVHGGPGNDTGVTDPCDDVDSVKEDKGPACPGIKNSTGKFHQTGELPAFAPVVECWTAPDGSRRILYLWEPEVRALDVTSEVDFQTVAWQGVVLKLNGTSWEPYIEGSWFWDRVYDLQVEAFAGNYWRSFATGQRTFVSYRLDSPGVYAVGVRLHWYKTAKAPEKDDVLVARAHYGPNEQAGHGSCEFPG